MGLQGRVELGLAGEGSWACALVLGRPCWRKLWAGARQEEAHARALIWRSSGSATQDWSTRALVPFPGSKEAEAGAWQRRQRDCRAPAEGLPVRRRLEWTDRALGHRIRWVVELHGRRRCGLVQGGGGASCEQQERERDREREKGEEAAGETGRSKDGLRAGCSGGRHAPWNRSTTKGSNREAAWSFRQR